MKLVGAGLHNYIDDTTMKITDLNRSVVGDHTKLLYRVRIRLISGLTLCCEVVVDAVEQELLALLRVSVDIWSTVTPAAAAVIQRIGIRRHHTGRQQRERHRITADQR